jgi:hypothetical protein
MRSITEKERHSVNEFLVHQGLTFQPLLDEMSDHICSEAEEAMSRGVTFEEAFKSIMAELPPDHFITIQTETMKTINNRFNLSRMFSWIGMSALLIATIFKILKLQGGGEVLLAGFVALGVALVAGVMPALTVRREEKGVVRVVAIVAGTLLLMFGYGFKVLHLPGGDELRILGVLISIVGIIMNTLFIHNNASGRGNLMTYMHEKHSPGIERFLLIVAAPVAIYKITRMFMLDDGRGSVADVVLVTIIYLAGLQLIALSWRTMEKKGTTGVFATIRVITIGICLMLPMLAEILPFGVRLASVTIFAVVAAMLVYQLDEEKWSWMVMISQVVFIGLALMKWNVIPFYSNAVVNLVILAIMIAGIFLAKKDGLLRTYMILSVASFMIESNLRVG